jgi:hypothetical protein
MPYEKVGDIPKYYETHGEGEPINLTGQYSIFSDSINN